MTVTTTLGTDQDIQGDTCVGAATQILGDKWTPLLLQYLSGSGPARFGQIQEAVGGINPRTLSARLDKLQEHGIITRQSFAEVPPRCEYSLTDKGRDLIPILEQMANWSKRHGLCLLPKNPC